MSEKLIKGLFASDIGRRIEEVIKVDQTDEQIIRDEIAEYVATDTIRGHFTAILDRYYETPNKPHEGIAVWISGFFGSGKSSFAKMLGIALDNRKILTDNAATLFGQRTGDKKIQVLLNNITEHVPTDSVIFDVSTDRGIRTGNQTITEIMYRLFLQRLGYAKDLDLSELEITLEAEGRLDEFKKTYGKLYKDKNWDDEKGKVAFAIQQASRVMNELEPETYPTADSWRESAKSRADITPKLLATRCKELMERRSPGRTLTFVIDEVGQFVARDVQKMLDLQAVVQSLGRVGRGKIWIAITSQEKLTELVGGLDDRRVELARLMDRFPLQVHLEPSDISEVTSKRVLSKNADAEKFLRDLFSQHRGRLTDNTRMTADIRLPEINTESFVDLYPLLPYQIDLIIQVVSGLRMQGGASQHVGGANRTIIKLAQQLLIHPDVRLADRPVGCLATIDKIYDLVAGNIGSEIRGKIDAIKNEVPHSLAQPVAKAICLLQYVKSIHRTAENIAASLHVAVDADSRLPEVKEALQALKAAHMVREGDDGYRIPSPAEDDWERQRSSLSPKPGDISRIHAETVNALWQPQPSHSFMAVKMFKAGLLFNGKPIVEGDMPVHLTFAEAREYAAVCQEMRARSQTETKSIFWTVSLDENIDRQTVEIYRSSEVLSRKERGAQTRDETALVAEEKARLNRHKGELSRLIKQACLSGTIYFRGNDRSPDDKSLDIGRTINKVLSQALPEVFDRFQEAAVKFQKSDLESLLTTENLRGLPQVFSALRLLRDEGGKPVFTVETGPLAEIMSVITNRTSYGEVADGRYLESHFGKDPFGWDFDIIRLLTVSLLRAGRIEATSKGQLIESALTIEAQSTFTNNQLFRQASFRPKSPDDVVQFTELVEACAHFKEVFGQEIPEIEQTVVALALRDAVAKVEEDMREVHTTLLSNGLPGADMLQTALNQTRTIRSGKENNAIRTFNGCYRELKDSIKRTADLNTQLTEPRINDIGRARRALSVTWDFLQNEKDLDDSVREAAMQLQDFLARETFYREFPAIDQACRVLEDEYERRFEEAVNTRAETYAKALEQLKATPGWEQLTPEQQSTVSETIVARTKTDVPPSTQIPLIRIEVDAAPIRLNETVEEMLRIVDGQRVVKVSASSYFRGGIETAEQLDSALTGLREECERLIGSGKKILIQ